MPNSAKINFQVDDGFTFIVRFRSLKWFFLVQEYPCFDSTLPAYTVVLYIFVNQTIFFKLPNWLLVNLFLSNYMFWKHTVHYELCPILIILRIPSCTVIDHNACLLLLIILHVSILWYMLRVVNHHACIVTHITSTSLCLLVIKHALIYLKPPSVSIYCRRPWYMLTIVDHYDCRSSHMHQDPWFLQM